MRVFKNNYKIGNKVLFLWEQVPYTGMITSIGTTTYGIMADACNYETDKMMIPRLENEVFLPKSLCKHTGEIYIDHRECSPFRTRFQYRFGDDIERAYEMLPKRTIFPSVMEGLQNQFIEFIPDKMFFKTKDNKIYFYCSTYTILPQLRTRDGILAKPVWLYQLPEKSGNCGYDTISEEDIDTVWEINSHVEGSNPWDAFTYGHTDIIYNINAPEVRTANESFGSEMERINIDMEKVPDDYVKYPKF